MLEQVANSAVIALEAYAVLGALFAVAFITVGVQHIDLGAKGSGPGFRLLIFPGSAAFWPLLLWRWTLSRNPPEERNPHQ